MAGLRQAVAARVLAIGGSWNEAPVPFDAHSWTAVPEAIPASKAHLSFSIGMGTTRASGNRHNQTAGVRCETDLPVRFLARLTPKDSLTSLDAALAAEIALIKQLDGARWSQHTDALWAKSERSSAPTGDWFRCDVTFTVSHLLALS